MVLSCNLFFVYSIDGVARATLLFYFWSLFNWGPSIWLKESYCLSNSNLCFVIFRILKSRKEKTLTQNPPTHKRYKKNNENKKKSRESVQIKSCITFLSLIWFNNSSTTTTKAIRLKAVLVQHQHQHKHKQRQRNRFYPSATQVTWPIVSGETLLTLWPPGPSRKKWSFRLTTW